MNWKRGEDESRTRQASTKKTRVELVASMAMMLVYCSLLLTFVIQQMVATVAQLTRTHAHWPTESVPLSLFTPLETLERRIEATTSTIAEICEPCQCKPYLPVPSWPISSIALSSSCIPKTNHAKTRAIIQKQTCTQTTCRHLDTLNINPWCTYTIIFGSLTIPHRLPFLSLSLLFPNSPQQSTFNKKQS